MSELIIKLPESIPSRIVICGYDYDVILDEALEVEQNLGDNDTSQQVIRLNPHQSKESLEETLLHEVIHVVTYYGKLRLKEKTVWRLSSLLFPTLSSLGLYRD